MLAKQHRLGRRDFTHYFASGKRYHSPYLTLIHSPNSGFKAAAVVSKKVAKKAHERNTVRRRIYAALATELQTDTVLTGVLIFIAKPTLASLPRLKQQEAVVTLLGMLQKER